MTMIQIKKETIHEKKLFIFDIEGVILPSIDEPQPVESAVNLINRLRQRGKKVAFLSNISRTPHHRVANILMRSGLAENEREIFTAGKVAVEYVRSKRKNARVFVVSERGLIVDFEMAGDTQISFEKPIDFVVIGMKRNISFQEINFALECVLEGAELISVGHTNYYQGEFLGRHGVFIGDVPICEMLSFAAGKPGKYTKIGKPSPTIYEYILREFGVKVPDAVMIGDKIETDIKGANEIGITSILIEQPPSTKKHFTPIREKIQTEPSIKVKNIKELLKFL